jgi:hypothetical protein
MAQTLKYWMVTAGLAVAMAGISAPAAACILKPAEKLEIVQLASYAPKHTARKRAKVRAMVARGYKLIAAGKLRAADRLANRALLAVDVLPSKPTGPDDIC